MTKRGKKRREKDRLFYERVKDHLPAEEQLPVVETQADTLLRVNGALSSIGYEIQKQTTRRMNEITQTIIEAVAAVVPPPPPPRATHYDHIHQAMQTVRGGVRYDAPEYSINEYNAIVDEHGNLWVNGESPPGLEPIIPPPPPKKIKRPHNYPTVDGTAPPPAPGEATSWGGHYNDEGFWVQNGPPPKKIKRVVKRPVTEPRKVKRHEP